MGQSNSLGQDKSLAHNGSPFSSYPDRVGPDIAPPESFFRLPLQVRRWREEKISLQAPNSIRDSVLVSPSQTLSLLGDRRQSKQLPRREAENNGSTRPEVPGVPVRAVHHSDRLHERTVQLSRQRRHLHAREPHR